MKHYVVGSNGRLGQSIVRALGYENVDCLQRESYGEWGVDGAEKKVKAFFDNQNQEGNTIYVVAGLLDPLAPKHNLDAVNYLLPRNIIEGAAALGMKIITFGTVLERLLRHRNNYVQSKIDLNEFIQTQYAASDRVLHVQLHTLYGVGKPSPFMFLGQILEKLFNDQPFQMTSGTQLREYHHFEDDAQAIVKISKQPNSGVLDLSHGKACTLESIAKSIFSAFGKSHLLEIAALPEPVEENYHTSFSKNQLTAGLNFREPLPGIVEYMRQQLKRRLV